jgi:hypothetical protein
MMTRTAVRALCATCVLLIGATLYGCASETESADQPQVPPPPSAVIVAPVVGASLSVADVTIELAAEHLTLAPAGTQEPNTGHLHLFINHDLTPEGEPIPQGEGIVHLGKAQTEHALEGLEPGDYTVIAVLGDWAHVRIPGAITDTVRFTVQ